MRKISLILLSCLTALLLGSCEMSDSAQADSGKSTDLPTASVQTEYAAEATDTAEITAAVTVVETPLILHSDDENPDPFYFEARLDKTVFSHGEPITFEVLLKNVGEDHPYNGDATHFRANVSLFYVDETGDIVTLQEMRDVTADETPNVAKTGEESVYTYQFFGADPEHRTPPPGTYGIRMNYAGYSVKFYDVITVTGESP